MTDEEFMGQALIEAEKAAKENEVPVGAVLVKDGKIVARGHNRREKKSDVTSHAEIEAIRQGEKKLGGWRLEGTTLYVTLEPCLMCAGAILQARIARLVYGAKDPKEGAIASRYFVYDTPSRGERPLVKGEVLRGESEKLLVAFFARKRKPN